MSLQEPLAAETAPKRRARWVLPTLLLIGYFFLKLQAWNYVQQANQLERELNELRPALSAKILSSQLERTEKACRKISGQVRQLDLQNGQLLQQLSKLPASIALERLENRTRLRVPLRGAFSVEGARPEPYLRSGLSIQGTLMPGSRDPESVLARWAQSLQSDGMTVQVRRLIPVPRNPAARSFELYLEGS